MTPAHAQIRASDPRASVFVAANAGSGKTSTLVTRVARLLLAGARPEAILCVTYTKAGAAEMQRRLFDTLGDWAVMESDALTRALGDIAEPNRDLSKARALFARALETPGGLKIQTLHAFCEKLLRRFPLEAGVSPGFTVLEDAAASDVSARAQDGVAGLAMEKPDGAVAAAYAHFSVELDWRSFNAMFTAFEARRGAIAAYVNACETAGGYGADVWRRCGFAAPTTTAVLERAAMKAIRWGQWSKAAEALLGGSEKTDRPLGAMMKAIGPQSTFAQVWSVFSIKDGSPRAKIGTQGVDPATRTWLAEEQARHARAREGLIAAAVAGDTVHALTLARAYAGLYEGAKDSRGTLDFADLVARTHDLLTRRADAAWVLYKLDGGLEHILLDEAQDTAPEQWEILRALTAEFFTGLGITSETRTVFAVGDEKQSIFSFQGAAPERLALETQAFGADVAAAGLRFEPVKLLESFRSAPEILSLVDKVFEDPEALAGLRPAQEDKIVGFPIRHLAHRPDAGCVELWPVEHREPTEETDPWAPVDSEPARSANKELARRIARAVAAMVGRGDAVADRESGARRPCRFGDVLILVRRRNPLFHEIIRALKREGAPVGGADRLKLSEHGVYQDLMALGRFARFVDDDLTLAALLRSPFCDMDEGDLFDLAHGREGSLWATLTRRGTERPAWDAAVNFLDWARGEGEGAAPFDFFSRALTRLDGAGRSMRQRVLTRLGEEGQDALDAFLTQALDAEARDIRDLETFLAAMASTELEVKREADEVLGRGEGNVRVMTVHGAKGLEAPIVILPDTTTRATAQGAALMETDAGGFVWAPRKKDDCPFSAAARERRDKASERESSRLLYVALTRARDRLIVAGVEARPHLYERSWRDYIQRAFDDLPIHAFALEGGAKGWRFGPGPVAARAMRGDALATLGLSAWTGRLAPDEPAEIRWAFPSSIAGHAVTSAPSPLAEVGGLGRYRRGSILHRLLQILPDMPVAARGAAARSLLDRECGLTDDQRAEMADAALAVLADARFAAMFGPDSRAEVALAGTVAGLLISGRVDRLVVEADRVLVADFKTNRPAPAGIKDADPAYITQMAFYAALLREIFPDRVVEAALLWTDGPRLMAVPENMMAKALADVVARP